MDHPGPRSTSGRSLHVIGSSFRLHDNFHTDDWSLYIYGLNSLVDDHCINGEQASEDKFNSGIGLRSTGIGIRPTQA